MKKRPVFILSLFAMILHAATGLADEYGKVHGPFTVYSHETFVKDDTGETGLHVDGESWYALVDLSGFADDKAVFTRPSQFLFDKSKEGIIVSIFAEKAAGVTDAKSCRTAGPYIPVQYEKDLGGKTVGINDFKDVRRSVHYRPYYKGYCFNFHFSMDPGKVHEEKVSRIIGSIRFTEGGLPKAQWRKTVYIGSKRLTMPVPDRWKLSFVTDKLPTMAFAAPKESDFKMGVSPMAGFGSTQIKPEKARQATEGLMSRAAAFAVTAPVLREYQKDDTVVYYFDATDKTHRPDAPTDYPHLRQGHALVKGAVLYFSIFYRDSGNDDASLTLSALENAVVVDLKR